MTVQELVADLSVEDPDTEVYIAAGENDELICVAKATGVLRDPRWPDRVLIDAEA